jgi:hypothetical protein
MNQTADILPAEGAFRVIDGVHLTGRVNTPPEALHANIASAIRRGHPQVGRQRPQPGRVCLVGGGPSLASTLPELRDLLWQGAKLVTVNGGYRWCIEHNLKPTAQIVMDARACNARFVDPPLPSCHYFLASQCHPSIWDAVEGREHVYIWHAISGSEKDDEDCAEQAILDAYYLKRWHGIAGGTTVVMRGLSLLRSLGYLRFDLFGVDSCWMHGAHHAFDQPENATDQQFPFSVHPTNHPELARTFVCSPAHVKQAEDLLQLLRFQGDHFLLNIHGDGLLAFILQSAADVVMGDDQAASVHVVTEGV